LRTSGRVKAGSCVVQEGNITNRCILDSGGVKFKRFATDSDVGGSGSISEERYITDGRVFVPGGVVNKRIITEKRVAVADVATVLTNRLRLRRKRKAAERQCDEN
jgi:hypothetical protein